MDQGDINAYEDETVLLSRDPALILARIRHVEEQVSAQRVAVYEAASAASRGHDTFCRRGPIFFRSNSPADAVVLQNEILEKLLSRLDSLEKKSRLVSCTSLNC
uniref:Uncharacterized protein n=1 Tax=Spongospora subterranea TaxID=70186 RepID=A0A0H5QFT9_9EUKA|eukprot:CRZ00800.1 hypothetical protein [Spongospora subterranea]